MKESRLFIMQKKIRILTMGMVLLLLASMTASQTLALPPKVGAVCVQDVEDGTSGGGDITAANL